MIKVKKGDVYGKLTLTGKLERRLQGKSAATYVECVCECGTKKWICLNSLRRGTTKGCGCQNRIHGMTNTRMFHIFNGMKQRCTNPRCRERNYYGGKGVKLIWKDFIEFYNDMHKSYYEHVEKYGENDTTIDRIDSEGNYCKDNCRWATRKEQSNNLSTNRKLNYNGKEYATMASMCRELGINKDVLRWRLNRGWNLYKAIEKPLQKHNINKNAMI